MTGPVSDAEKIVVTCGCGKHLKFPRAYVGKPAACPACKRRVLIVGRGAGADGEGARGQLLIQQGAQHAGTQAMLLGSAPLDIGKHPQADLCLVGEQVSRSHCRLVPTNTGWRIRDRKSTNGLFVNGKRVNSQELRDRDRIRIGEYELIYLAPGSSPAQAVAPAAAATAAPREQRKRDPLPSEAELAKDDGIYGIADDIDDILAAASQGPKLEQPRPATTAACGGRAASAGDGPTCPACKNQLATGSRICIECGINVKTGRSILTAQEDYLDEIYEGAENIIAAVSWIVPTGIYPMASEAFGSRKPYMLRAIAVITIITSVWFLYYDWTDSPKMLTMKNLMLWTGEADPDPELLDLMYTYTNYGDGEAFLDKIMELEEAQPELSMEELTLAAHNALPPEQQCLGRYRPSQLITHALLHGGPVHLIGNLIFLLVFGSRINAMLGNLATLVLYPILAIGAALVFMASAADQSPAPMLGASGAIMGLAGMYFVLAPAYNVHMAAWARLGLVFGFRLHLKMWPVRGFWVVLFYIAFDVVFTILGVEDGTAHWAHLGGFIVGGVIALALLLARLINARGGDLISVLLGRFAWALIGKPRREVGIIQRLP